MPRSLAKTTARTCMCRDKLKPVACRDTPWHHALPIKTSTDEVPQV